MNALRQQRASAPSCACSTSAAAASPVVLIPLRARQGVAALRRRPRTCECFFLRQRANKRWGRERELPVARALLCLVAQSCASGLSPCRASLAPSCVSRLASRTARASARSHTLFPPPSPPHTPHHSALRAFEPFSENAAQVKRLISRDRKQFLGNEGDILDKFETEFGDGDEAATTTAAAAATATAAPAAAAPAAAAPTAAPKPATPAAAPAPKPASPFGGGGTPASPFGTAPAATSSPFGVTSAPGAALNARSKIEPAGLSPTLGPDPLAPAAPPTPGGFLSRITLTSVVLVLSFSTIIGLMLATFRVAVNAGAIRLAGVE
jgi:hypothetical protein